MAETKNSGIGKNAEEGAVFKDDGTSTPEKPGIKRGLPRS